MPWLRTVLLCSLLTSPLLACEDDGSGESGSGDGDRVTDVPSADLPSGDDQDDPTGPGLEPPNNGGDTTPGAAPASPPTPGVGMPPTTGTAGTTGGAPVDMGTANDSDAGAADCGDFQGCDVSTPCTDSGLHCIVVPSCGGPLCIDPDEACTIECGATGCAILESYPEQLACP